MKILVFSKRMPHAIPVTVPVITAKIFFSMMNQKKGVKRREREREREKEGEGESTTKREEPGGHKKTGASLRKFDHTKCGRLRAGELNCIGKPN